MNRLHRTFLFTLLITSLLAGTGFAPLEQGAPPEPSSSIDLAAGPATDAYGYTYTEIPFAWIDCTPAAGGTRIEFSNPDDGRVPLDLGFSFPFYENTFVPGSPNPARNATLLVSLNGVVTFGQTTDRDHVNEKIPQPSPLNNLIAPYWDDLRMTEESGVYYRRLDGPDGRRLVIQWDQMTLVSNIEARLTFEVVLIENGTIEFLYQQLDGQMNSATVGIEDGDGVNGLRLRYDGESLDAGTALRITRPVKPARSKFLSNYQSDFLVQNTITFKLALKNLHPTDTDRFNLTYTTNQPGWKVELLEADGITPLVDADGNGDPDIDILGAGETVNLAVKITASPNAKVGDYIMVYLTAHSTTDRTLPSVTRLQAAKPAAFAQAVIDQYNKVRQLRIWDRSISESTLVEKFSGRSLSMTTTARHGTLMAWEWHGLTQEGVRYTNIEYTLLDRFGQVLKAPQPLVDHSNTTKIVEEGEPFLASAPDGTLGMVWVRGVVDNQAGGRNSNVFFAVMSPEGDWQVIQVTDNKQYRSQANPGAPLYYNPTMTATSDNRFVLAWQELASLEGGNVSNLGVAAYTGSGQRLSFDYPLAPSLPGGIYYMGPSLSPAGSGQAVLSYAVSQPGTSVTPLRYILLSSSGQLLRTPAEIPGSNGRKSSQTQMEGGEVLIAWVDQPSGEAAFVVLGAGDYRPLSDIVVLENEHLRAAENISVTWTFGNKAVLTWMDGTWNRYLSYALVDNTGAVLTPPMIFVHDSTSDALVLTSVTGQGNAPYDGNYWMYLPSTRK